MAKSRSRGLPSLCCESVASEVFPRYIASQFIVGPIYAVPVERGAAASRTEVGIIGKDLTSAQTPIFVERCSVGLEEVLTSQCLGKEIRCESEKSSTDRIEMVGPSIPGQPCADGPEIGVQPDFRGNRKVADIIWPDRNKRMPIDKTRARKKFPPYAAEEFPEEGIASQLRG